MTEKIKSDELIPAGAGQIAELKAENERLRRELARRPAAKRFITTSQVTAAPTISGRPNTMISTTHPRPRPISGRMLQTHGLPEPQTPEAARAEILDRVKKDRAADVQKKKERSLT